MRSLTAQSGLPHQSVRSYFGKMYEAKFLLGALAASMADNHRIGYHASVFASGALSEINAFAIGASLLDLVRRLSSLGEMFPPAVLPKPCVARA